MFEERSANEVESLLKSNNEFRQLYQHHQELDRRVMNAELGVNPVDDLELVRMKREKLHAKDRLVRMADTLTTH
ncbi:YdcH family protein [Lysobacter humi (ex Lee et al. 2017)]